MTIALFPGSFDPFHQGHLQIVEWAAANHDEVVVAVLGNPDKPAGMFAPDERVRLAALATSHLANVRCLNFRGLTGALAREQNADVIIRSAHKEEEVERTLAVINKFMSGGVPTEFAPPDPGTESISATTIRELILAGDFDVAVQMVPEGMRDDLRTAPRLDPAGSRRTLPAVTGPLNVGRRVETLRIAAVQESPVFLDRDASLDKALGLVEQAAGQGARLVVFPEAFLPGYPHWVWKTTPWDDRANALYGRLFDNAVVVGSAVTQVLALAAQRHELYLSIGIDEREATGSTLYSTQLLFAPDGSLASTHRKLVPSGAERLVWGMGDGSGMKIVETQYGRMGALTSWENYMPLARAALYSQGVDVYLAPTWDNSSVWPSTLRHIAREGRVFVVGVNQCLRACQLPDELSGRDLYDDDIWLANGNSMIVGPGGDVLAGPLSEQSGIVTADVDVNDSRHSRQQFDPAGHYNRPDTFGLRLDFTHRAAMTTVDEKPPAGGGPRPANAPSG